MGFCEDIMTGPVVCTYFAVVLILLVVVFMHVTKLGGQAKERFRTTSDHLNGSWHAGNPHTVEAPVGIGYINASLTNGSSVGKSVLTDTGQNPYGTGYTKRDDPNPNDM